MNETAGIVLLVFFAMGVIAYTYYSKRHRQTPKKKSGISRPTGGGGNTPE